MREDVAKAVTIIEDAQRTHREWQEFLEANPDWTPDATASIDGTVGSPDRHREYVANYDHVLTVLRSIDPEPDQVVGPHLHMSRPPGVEAPWPSTPPEATLMWLDEPPAGVPDLGYVHWFDVNNDRAAIPVTHAGDTQLTTSDGGTMNVWHIEELPDGLLRVSPSVHFIGYWHSPNPVTFRRVEQLTDPAR